MDSFFFGPRQSLYGAYHPASLETAAPESAVLVCNAFGPDYMRSLRALWQLAEQAADRNVHVLRFDYFGTGDSHGLHSQANLDRWRDDVRQAADALRERSGLEQITLLGLRLGALVACDMALHVAADRLLLWDAVSSGGRYFDRLRDLHVRFTRSRSRNRYRSRRYQYATEDSDELLGFHCPDALVQPLRDLTLSELLMRSGARHVALLQGQHDDDDDAAADSVATLGGHVRALPEPAEWDRLHTLESRLPIRRNAPMLIDAMVAA